MSKKIICLGSLSLDIFFPYEDIAILDTPNDTLSKQKMVFEIGAKYRAQDRYDAPGGCAVNVAQGLSRLGHRSFLISMLGEDNLGESLLKEVSKEGVDISLVSRKKEYKTDIGIIVIDKKTGERTIFYNRDANEHIDFSQDMFSFETPLFLGGLYGDWKKGIGEIFQYAKNSHCPVYYNPSHNNIESDALVVWEKCLESEGVFLNKDEAMELFTLLNKKNISSLIFDEGRLESEEYLASSIARSGHSRFVVITDGSRGAWAYDRSFDSVFRQEGKSIDIVKDSTGAGDSFTSGFLSAIFYGKSTKIALEWGINNATNVIKYYGAKEGLLSLEDMETVNKKENE
ncbi:MAG: carbohydrate kinase family protein [Candidatus Moranbacteria bacterium]|nr:carbohydrate kinase family protein [Candidatus Moranbacteria bacterium]